MSTTITVKSGCTTSNDFPPKPLGLCNGHKQATHNGNSAHCALDTTCIELRLNIHSLYSYQ